MDSYVDTDVSEKHAVSIFSPVGDVSIIRAEDGDSMFLLEVGIYLQVHTALQPRTTSTCSPPPDPQVS
jgi:hypothetical protein